MHLVAWWFYLDGKRTHVVGECCVQGQRLGHVVKSLLKVLQASLVLQLARAILRELSCLAIDLYLHIIK